MGIDRHNYETWFLRYVDEELTAAEKSNVDAFLVAHPDLGLELEALLATRLEAEMPLFPMKSTLYRHDPLTPTATESELMQWLDGELNQAEQSALQRRVDREPSIAQAWKRFQQTKLSPETIAFPNKASLYRHEQARVVPMRWLRYAAAAVLIAAMSWGGWIAVRTNSTTPANALVRQEAVQPLSPSNQSNASNPAKDQPQESTNVNQLASVDPPTAFTAEETTNPISTSTKEPASTIDEGLSENISSTPSNISTATNVPNPTATINTLASASGASESKPVDIVATAKDPAPTTYASYASLSDSPNGYSLNDDEFDDDDRAPRSKVGGLIRKVKRTITGNAEASSASSKGVRVAAFKIASH